MLENLERSFMQKWSKYDLFGGVLTSKNLCASMFRTLDALGIAGRVVYHRHTWLTRSSRVGRNARKRRRFPQIIKESSPPVKPVSSTRDIFLPLRPNYWPVKSHPPDGSSEGSEDPRFTFTTVRFFDVFRPIPNGSIRSVRSRERRKRKKFEMLRFVCRVRHWEKKNLWLTMMETDVFPGWSWMGRITFVNARDSVPRDENAWKRVICRLGGLKLYCQMLDRRRLYLNIDDYFPREDWYKIIEAEKGVGKAEHSIWILSANIF